MIEACRLNRFHILLGMFLALCALFAAQPLRAQGTNLDATLVAGGPAIAGETVTVAIHFSPRTKEWHGYWSNPGDAGLGLESGGAEGRGRVCQYGEKWVAVG